LREFSSLSATALRRAGGPDDEETAVMDMGDLPENASDIY
jgi:hypothetical protein